MTDDTQNSTRKFASRADRKSFFEMKKGNKNFSNRNKFNRNNSKFSRNRDDKNVKDRIAKRLSMLGVASRREAEKLVLDGKVKINGVECKDLTQLVSFDDKIYINGKEIINKPIRTQIYLMNKPSGYVTTNNDPQGRKTIFELIPSKFGRLITIGRLDFNTEGILLLTNNGELARIMEMPATGLKRVYYAKVIGEIDDKIKEKLENLRKGIKIDGTEYGKMIVEIEDYSQTKATLRIVIFEGKNNEIRRVMWHLGLKVIKLTRVQYGDFRLNGLPSGCVQESHFRIDIRELERQASKNIKRYNERKERIVEKEQKKEQQQDINKIKNEIKNEVLEESVKQNTPREETNNIVVEKQNLEEDTKQNEPREQNIVNLSQNEIIDVDNNKQDKIDNVTDNAMNETIKK